MPYGPKPLPPVSEKVLHQHIAQYIRAQYPRIIFFTDSGSGAYFQGKAGALTKKKMQALNSADDVIPDMFIAEPRTVEMSVGEFTDVVVMKFAGFYIEVKKDGTRLFKRDGHTWATPHIAEQAKTLQRLRDRGYAAEFAVGFDDAKKQIDQYLKFIF